MNKLAENFATLCVRLIVIGDEELADNLAKFGQTYVVNKLAENFAAQSSLLMTGCVNSGGLYAILLNSCIQEANLPKLANEIRGGSRVVVWGGPLRSKYGKYFVAMPFRLSENVGRAPLLHFRSVSLSLNLHSS